MWKRRHVRLNTRRPPRWCRGMIPAPEAEHSETTLMVHRSDPCTCAYSGLHRADPGASQNLVLDLLPGEDSQKRETDMGAHACNLCTQEAEAGGS
ncbi:hypothetical protein LEMLEM_LOCUS11742 [Lemmus lemmus]